MNFDWRKRQQARADVLKSIKDILDAGLSTSYTKEVFVQKVEVVYQHVYESYFGAGQSIYPSAA